MPNSNEYKGKILDVSDHPVYKNIKQVTIDGQEMIQIPKCFVKREVLNYGKSNETDKRWVSDVALPGFEPHPAFTVRTGGKEADDCIYIGKWLATTDSNKIKLCSVEYYTVLKVALGLLSDSQTTIYTDINRRSYINTRMAKQMVESRNVNGVNGFHLFNIQELSLIQLLFLVQYGHADSQRQLGVGASRTGTGTTSQQYLGIQDLWGIMYVYVDNVDLTNRIKINNGNGYEDTNMTNSDNFWISHTYYDQNNKYTFIGNCGNLNEENPNNGLTELSSYYKDENFIHVNSNSSSNYYLFSGGNGSNSYYGLFGLNSGNYVSVRGEHGWRISKYA